MDENRQKELFDLARQRIELATNHIRKSGQLTEIRKAFTGEEAEIPGFETRPMKFGQFTNKEFVVMMTDIRRSTDIINSEDGLVSMFKIFYAYSALVANIVDRNFGTSTEFLGDGVLNLFEVDENRHESFRQAIRAARDIHFARANILNPIFTQVRLPNIRVGIGIDHGITIVTRFGYKSDNDLKAFGKCIYNVSRLCKGDNDIIISPSAQINWPTSPDGRLQFTPVYDADNNLAYQVSNI